MQYDYCIVGGGIVGIATAFSLQGRFPAAKIVLLEKENEIAQHQSGNNSGVIHAGVYYELGSLKARLCRNGSRAIRAFCDQHDIVYNNCGKHIVATNALEESRLDELQQRCLANGIPFEEVSGDELKEREPMVRGTKALFFPETSIVNYAEVARKMAALFVENGGKILHNAEVISVEETDDQVLLATKNLSIASQRAVFCAGAQSDRLARLAGQDVKFKIIPFRGEYYEISSEFHSYVSTLIYPVPDPDLPFLGIHLTLDVAGNLTVGPNAVLGLSREGLAPFSINFRDAASIFFYRGFWAFLVKNLRSGVLELMSSIFKSRYLKECQKYLPSLQKSHLTGKKAGVRAQVVLPNGEAIHDFLTLETARTVHICNAPSPAATSSLAIAEMIIDDYLKLETKD